MSSDVSDRIMDAVFDQLLTLNEKFDRLSAEMVDIESRLKQFKASEDKEALEKALVVMHRRIDEVAAILNIRRKLKELEDEAEEEDEEDLDHQKDCQNEIVKLYEEPEIVVPTPNELPDVEIKTHLFYSERSLILMQSEVYEDNLYLCPSFVWKIENVEAALLEKHFRLTSAIFPLAGYRVGAQAILEGRGQGSVQLSLSLKNVKGYSRPLSMKLFPRVTYIVKDRCSSDSRDVIKSYVKLFGSSLQCEAADFTKSLVRKTTFTDPPFTVDDEARLEVHVEPQSLAQHAFSYDGVLMDRVEGYSRKVRLAQERLLEWELSPYFYTGSGGYRVQVWLRLRYQLEVRVRFLQGEFDERLSQEFPRKTTVVLFNCADPEGHVVKSKTSVNVAEKNADCFKFGTHKHVEKLLRADTLYYKVSIVSI